MKGRSLSILGIFAAAVGAVLILCFNSIKITGVIITAGILFVGVGLVNLIFYSAISKNENAAGRVLTLITNSAAIMLGISMLVFQSVFAPLISFMFGLLIATCALWQFFTLAVGTRPYQLPAWLYVFPVLLTGAAVYVFMIKDKGQDHVLMLTTGIAMAVLGVGCLLEGSCLGIARRNFEKARTMHQPAHEPVHETVAYEPAPAAPAAPVPPADKPVETAAPVHEAPRLPARPVETTDDLDDEIQ